MVTDVSTTKYLQNLQLYFQKSESHYNPERWDLFAILGKKNKAKMMVNILLKCFAFTLKALSVE